MASRIVHLRVRCGKCGHEQESDVLIEAWHEQLPLVQCRSCLQLACEITVRPYALSENDRRLLRSMKIRQDV